MLLPLRPVSFSLIDDYLPFRCRCLCYPRGIELSRSATGSLGFSIVGGCDGGTRDPIHVLFVVQNSPAAIEGT